MKQAVKFVIIFCVLAFGVYLFSIHTLPSFVKDPIKEPDRKDESFDKDPLKEPDKKDDIKDYDDVEFSDYEDFHAMTTEERMADAMHFRAEYYYVYAPVGKYYPDELLNDDIITKRYTRYFFKPYWPIW